MKDKISLKEHEEIVSSLKGTITGLKEEILDLKNRLNKIYSKHTGKSVSEISDALERDNFMTADEAKKFGLIDSVVEKRK